MEHPGSGVQSRNPSGVPIPTLIERPPSYKGTDTLTDLDKVLYTAKPHASGGLDDVSRRTDGRLDVKLSRPGGPGSGTNPEQLFSAGWSACFMSSMQLVAGRMKVALPADQGIEAGVDLGLIGDAYVRSRAKPTNLPSEDSGPPSKRATMALPRTGDRPRKKRRNVNHGRCSSS